MMMMMMMMMNHLVKLSLADVIVNVCVLEVKTTSTAMFAQPYMSEHSPRPYVRRSDPYAYSGAGGQPSVTANRPQLSATRHNSAMTGGVGSLTSNRQGSSDTIASHLASLRHSAEEPMQTFGMLGSQC